MITNKAIITTKKKILICEQVMNINETITTKRIALICEKVIKQRLFLQEKKMLQNWTYNVYEQSKIKQSDN